MPAVPSAPCPAAGDPRTSPAAHTPRTAALSPAVSRCPPSSPRSESRLPSPWGLLRGRAQAGQRGARCRPCAAPSGEGKRAAVQPRGADARSRRCVHVRGCVRGATTRGGTCGGCERGGGEGGGAVRGRAASGRGRRRFPPYPPLQRGAAVPYGDGGRPYRVEIRVEIKGRRDRSQFKNKNKEKFKKTEIGKKKKKKKTLSE